MDPQTTLHVYGSCSTPPQQLMQKFDTANSEWLKTLKGGWSLAFKQNDNVVLATDRWGTRPLFYTLQNQKLLFSENIDELAQSLTKTTLNQEALARFLLEDFSHPQETIYKEIQKVPQGTLLTCHKGILNKSRWIEDPEWKPESRDFSQTVKEWKKELTLHLEILLPQHKKWGFFVSGGLDSAGLVALSMDLIKKHLWPVTIELYNMTSEHSECDDQGFCQKLADHYQIPLHRYLASSEELKNIHSQWQNTNTSLPYFPTLQMFEPLMKMAAQNQCTGLIFGYGADEQWTLPSQTLGLDFLKSQKWSLFLKNRSTSESLKTYLLNVLKLWARQETPDIVKKGLYIFNSMGIPQHLQNRKIFKEQRKQLKKRMQKVENKFTSQTQKQLYLRNFISGNNQHNLACHGTLAGAHGLEVHFPYLSSELLDISLRSSPELFYLAKDKSVLRELLVGHLLEEIRTAPKFQDYSQLAHETALQLAHLAPNLICLQDWIQPDIELVHFDSDFFFEILYAEKLLKTDKGADED